MIHAILMGALVGINIFVGLITVENGGSGALSFAAAAFIFTMAVLGAIHNNI